MQRILDLNLPELQVYTALSERQLLNLDCPEEGLFIAESPKVILRALDAGYAPVSLLMEESRTEAAEERQILSRCPEIPVYVGPMEVLRELTGFPMTRGTLCAMRRRPEPSVQTLCRSARRIAVLENVMNPTNLGAIFRSAAALSMDAVLLTRGCTDPLYRRAIRVSMGTVFQIPWAHIGRDAASWPQAGMAELKAMGFRTAAMALREDCIPIDAPELMHIEKLAIVLGTEGDGLADGTIAACDYAVRIPMAAGVDSLNVAAASAVAFRELRAR